MNKESSDWKEWKTILFGSRFVRCIWIILAVWVLYDVYLVQPWKVQITLTKGDLSSLLTVRGWTMGERPGSDLSYFQYDGVWCLEEVPLVLEVARDYDVRILLAPFVDPETQKMMGTCYSLYVEEGKEVAFVELLGQRMREEGIWSEQEFSDFQTEEF